MSEITMYVRTILFYAYVRIVRISIYTRKICYTLVQDRNNKINGQCLSNIDQQTKIIESEIMTKIPLKIDTITLELRLI